MYINENFIEILFLFEKDCNSIDFEATFDKNIPDILECKRIVQMLIEDHEFTTFQTSSPSELSIMIGAFLKVLPIVDVRNYKPLCCLIGMIFIKLFYCNFFKIFKMNLKN